MKRILKKMLVIVLILLILNNFIITSVQANEASDVLGSALGGLFSGVVGILTWLYRAPAVMIGWLINRFMTTLAYAEGSTDPTVNTSLLSLEFLSVFDILFNKVKILDINFFDLTDGDASLVGKFRLNVATWFYIMRNISAGILLVILIYVGIRMAFSTVASDRAMYTRMLADWAVSLFLIFILNYIIIFTIEINNALVRAMAEGGSTDGLESVMATLGGKGINPFGGISSIVAAIIYIMLIWQTMGLFFSYFNRMLKIAFLIIISPLISLTYSIDKMGDGKAQALDAWLKEFVFTILMQPFHCAIYMSLISTAINVLIGLGGFNKISETLGAGILALVCINFMKEAEKIVRHIFNFQDDNNSTSLAAGAMLATATLSKAKNIGTGGVKAFQSTKSFLTEGKNALRLTNLKAEGKAAWKYLHPEKNEDGTEVERKDYKDIRSEERKKAFNDAATRLEKKENKRMKDIVAGSDSLRKEARQINKNAVETEKARLAEEGIGNTDEEREALARFNVAKSKTTSKAIKTITKPKSTNGKVQKFTSAAKRVGNTIGKSEVFRLALDESKNSAGFFMFAGNFGSTGKVFESGALATATNKAVSEFASNRAGSVASSVDDLLNSHTEVENVQENTQHSTDPKDSVRDKKSEVLSRVMNNPNDYNLEGDDIPDKLQKIIDEINSACNCNLNAAEIKQTIQHSSNPAVAISSMFAGRIDETKPSGAKAMSKLKDYGTEYAISKKLSEGAQNGVSSGEVYKKITAHKGVTIPKITETTVASVIAEKISNNEEVSVDEIAKVSENITGDEEAEDRDVRGIETISEGMVQYEKDWERLEQAEYGRLLHKGRASEAAELKEHIEARKKEFESKRALLIAEAVKQIKDKEQEGYDELYKKAMTDIEEILKKEPENKNDLIRIKSELEKI